MSRFNEINVGDVAELSHKITKADIDKFVELTGDDNKLHIDNDFASKTSFKKPVAHGMLGASFISTIIGTKLPGDGALWFSQNLEFIRPVRVGDVITIKAEVIKMIEKNQIIELSTVILNQDNQIVTNGAAKVKVVDREEQKIEEIIESKPKVALVIGGTGGIGKAACLQLANDGFDIAIHYNSNKNAATDLKLHIEEIGRKAIIVTGEISNEKAVNEIAESIKRKFGIITVVANCSGIRIPNVRFLDSDWLTMQQQFDFNIKGTFNLVKVFAPLMEQNKYGKFINTSTLFTDKIESDWLSHYVTAKSALSGFSKSIAYELAPKGIRVNIVSPGMTETELIADIPEKIRLMTASQTPLRRLAKPEDVAGCISFLASDKSDYLTGETIRVNGGQIMI